MERLESAATVTGWERRVCGTGRYRVEGTTRWGSPRIVGKGEAISFGGVLE